MKRSIFAFLVLLGAMVISIASPLIFNHYVNGIPSLTGDATESVAVEEAVTQVTNPAFVTADDAVQFQRCCIKDYTTDSIFRAIPQEAIITISNVLIGRERRATKQSIVEEFIAEYDKTYKFIKQKPAPPNEDTIKIRTISQDTIINGQRWTLIKQINSNE